MQDLQRKAEAQHQKMVFEAMDEMRDGIQAEIEHLARVREQIDKRTVQLRILAELIDANFTAPEAEDS